MHPMLEQMKSVMHHHEAFEDETLRRFRLKVVRHGHDRGHIEYIYSNVNSEEEEEDFGCRAVLGTDETWFEVFYQAYLADREQVYSLILAYRPAVREYSLEVEAGPEGVAEVAAVLGQDHAVKDGKRLITADQYALIGACMAKRYAERRG